MKISVIIPVKNRALLLPITLESIFQQTFQPHEIIVVNDHSSDNLEEALMPYLNRIIFVHSSKTGPGAARNRGLEIASGDAIQFFDSDDIMSPNKLEVQSKLLVKLGKLGMVYGPHVKAEWIDNQWEQRDVIMQYNPLPNNELFTWIKRGWCPITQSVLFTKELIDTANPWREDIFPHEDLVYWYHIGKQKPSIAHENQSCVIYRQHGSQITDQSTSLIHKAQDRVVALEIIWKDLQETSKLTFKDSIYQEGRLYGSQDYLMSLDKSVHQNIYSKSKWGIFRILNKLERIMSGTNWETMYGTNKSATLFKKIVTLY